MFCADGVELLREYRICIAQRVEARDRLMSASANVRSEWEENLYGANHAYSGAFVAWVTHRSTCSACRSESIGHDQEQFASV